MKLHMLESVRSVTKSSTLIGAALCSVVAVAAVAVSAGALPNQPLSPTLAAPGTVLTSEPWTQGGNVTGASSMKKVTYTSKDGTGQTTLTSGFVALPMGAAPVGGWPVMAYAHGTVGMADVDAPTTHGLYPYEASYVSHWLASGYAVAFTDYAGLGTPGTMQYLDGKSAAYNVVDSVRALRASFPQIATKYAVAGLSQGGHAALFTGRYAKTYAPELSLKAVAASGPATNIENLAPLGGPLLPDLPLNGLTLFVTYMLAGFNTARPDQNISQYLTPLGINLMQQAPNLSVQDMVTLINGAGLNDIFKQHITNPTVLAALKAYMGVPVSGFTAPVFISQGVTDTTVPAPLTWKQVADMQLRLQWVDLHTYPGGHTDTLGAAQADATAFMARFVK
jgi:hypothetical protein